MIRAAFIHDGHLFYFLESGEIQDAEGNRFSLRMAPDDLRQASIEARARVTQRVLAKYWQIN